MRLKSLEIHGFKSFADKTTLEFHEGVTGIVGPNGCGKSNVVDAIRWVLGETSAKALRGGEMADVIFNGTDKRKPSAMAAVSLNLTDCEEALGIDYNEVTITRRVYKDGKSEYRINNTLCRLRDIHDLFLDTGIGRSAYSIMEQGKIDQLLSSKPEDRRAVFEEAAGISKFKKEKKEALRKLEYTSANLLRVSDVLEEQERRINALKRQVSKARRFKDLSDDVKTFESHLAHQEYRELLAGRNQLNLTLKELSKKISENEKALPLIELTLTKKRATLAEEENASVLLNQNLSNAHSTVKESEGQLRLNAERRDDYRSRITRNTSEITDNEARLSLQEKDLKETLTQVEEIHARMGDQEETLKAHKTTLETVRIDRQKTEKEEKENERLLLATERKIASIKAKLESHKVNSASTLERSDTLKAEAISTQKALLTIDSFLVSQKEKITLHEAEKKGLDAEKAEAEKNLKTLRQDLDAIHQSLRETQSHLSSRASRLEVLENLLSSGEGLGKGTQSVLSGLNDPQLYKPLLGGTIVKNISVDERYVTAVEAALGKRLSSIIVKDDSAAASIIETLTKKSLGKAELLVTPFITANQEDHLKEKPSSAIGWAIDLLSVEKAELRNTLISLLSKTLIIPDIETAFMLRPTYEGVTFVTLAGEVLTPEGFLSGGKTSKENTSSLRLKNEISELKSEISKHEKAIHKQEKQIEDITASIGRSSEQTEKAAHALQEHLLTHNTLKSELNNSQRERTGIHHKKEQIEREQSSISQRQKSSSDALSLLDKELSSLQLSRTEIEQKLFSITEQIKKIRESEITAFDALSELQTSVAVEKRSYDALQRQKEPLQARIIEIKEINRRREKETETYQLKISSSIEKDKELQERIGNSQAGVKQFTEKLSLTQAQLSKTREAISSQEVKLSQARRDLLQLTEKRGSEDVELTKIDLKIENLIATLRERHRLELSEFNPNVEALSETLNKRSGEEENASKNPPPLSEIDWALVEELSAELRKKLDGMGPVNVDAIQEYEELEERHSFVRGQYDDLTSAKEELLIIIDKINKETTILFSETFTAVKENFREMFKELFGERGKADLVLVDDDDPLESGIEIIAKPPGKKLQSITLLSGGERSMTAVALLFSIYMVKPSPFCVLDELDAPLDESNISRFLNMLEKFISQSQFIIVTHNKRTMERADVLYGVTMQELGISRPVGMVLSQAQGIVDQGLKNKKSADSKTDKSTSPAKNAAAQISS